MNRLHYIAKSMSVLNCLLSISITTALYYIAAPLTAVEIRKTVPAVQKTAAKSVNLSPSLPNPSFSD